MLCCPGQLGVWRPEPFSATWEATNSSFAYYEPEPEARGKSPVRHTLVR